MKKQYFTSIIKNSFILLLSSLILISCNNDNSMIDDEANLLDISSAVIQSEIDDVSIGIDDIIESIYFDIENSTVSKNAILKSSVRNSLPGDCATITKISVDNFKTVTIDFGDGCLNKNENYLSGKIIIEIAYNNEDQSVSIDNTFDNFYFNYKKVEGEVHKIRIKSNENGNPQATINKNIEITREDGSIISVQGERIREWIEGSDNKIWSDNVFLITGFWAITNKDGVIMRTSTIIKPLKRKTACKFIISGIVEIQKGDKSIILNYGDGECDDLAIATKEGIDYEIHLRKNF